MEKHFALAMVLAALLGYPLAFGFILMKSDAHIEIVPNDPAIADDMQQQCYERLAAVTAAVEGRQR